MKENQNLRHWQEIIQADESAYSAEIQKMEERERIFQGERKIRPVLEGDEITETPYVRNFAAELIECQIDSTIPQPHVEAVNPADRSLAKLIEDMIRNRLDKLPMESVNDRMERTVPTQGGGFLQYDWDNKGGSHTMIGEGVVKYLHPKLFIPQQGITSDLDDMEHFALKLPQTVDFIQRQYGVTVSEGEDDPALRSATGEAVTAPGLVDQYLIFYRNAKGGVGVYSYVRDIELLNIEEYQARHRRVCKKCGAAEGDTEPLGLPTLDGSYPAASEPFEKKWEAPKDETPKPGGTGGKCQFCGGTMADSVDDFFVCREGFQGEDLSLSPGERVPYYKPDIYPVFLQQNVSAYGKLLGDSDIDKISDQQNLSNRTWAKIIAQLLNAGSYVTLPDDTSIPKDSREGKVIPISDPSKKAMIDVIDLTANISPGLEAQEEIYRQAQIVLGITDSFLGRKDTTATSGKAKEFSAAQAAGRLESKRVMKREMYARFFEAIFKFELAYRDEEMTVTSENMHGETIEESWSKFKFLKRDAAGELYWNTDFLFSTDSAAALAQNREAQWQEMRSHFESGAMGDPTQVNTQIRYWTIMEKLHYPGAARIKTLLDEDKTAAAQLQLQQAQAQQQAGIFADERVQQMMGGAMNDLPTAY